MKEGPRREKKRAGPEGKSQGQSSQHESIRQPSTMRTESVNVESHDAKREQAQPFDDTYLPELPM